MNDQPINGAEMPTELSPEQSERALTTQNMLNLLGNTFNAVREGRINGFALVVVNDQGAVEAGSVTMPGHHLPLLGAVTYMTDVVKKSIENAQAQQAAGAPH